MAADFAAIERDYDQLASSNCRKSPVTVGLMLTSSGWVCGPHSLTPPSRFTIRSAATTTVRTAGRDPLVADGTQWLVALGRRPARRFM